MSMASQCLQVCVHLIVHELTGMPHLVVVNLSINQHVMMPAPHGVQNSPSRDSLFVTSPADTQLTRQA